MNILITGINGFIGTHLAEELLRRGHIVSGLGKNKKSALPAIKKYYSGSVLDKNIVEKAMKGMEVVIHLAALTAHKEIIDNKFQALETNFLGTKNILDAFSASKTAKRFFYSSTGKVYGKIEHLPITEEHPAHPLNILGKSKLITEKLIDFYSTDTKEFIIFRIFNIYGPAQKENFLVPTILKQLDEGKKEITLGDMEAKRDYVYIDDLINAFVLAIEAKGSVGISTYNICTGQAVSAANIVDIISTIKKQKIIVKKNPALLRSDEMKDEYGSYKTIKKKIGWKPTYSIETGLKKLLNS